MNANLIKENLQSFMMDSIRPIAIKHDKNLACRLMPFCAPRISDNDQEMPFDSINLFAFNPQGLELLPRHLQPLDVLDACLDREEYWQEVNEWVINTFNIISNSSQKMNVNFLKRKFISIMQDPVGEKRIVYDSIKYRARQIKRNIYRKKLCELVNNVLNSINLDQKPIEVSLGKPIDAFFANAEEERIVISPFTLIDWDSVPLDIRPTGTEDERLYDLNFLQKISDWIANEFNIPKAKVGLFEIAAIKTVLKLRENPLDFQKVIRTAIAHEIGHVLYKHALNDQFTEYTWEDKPFFTRHFIQFLNNVRSIKFKMKDFFFACKKNENEADEFAISGLEEGREGIRIGCHAWQKSLVDLRASNALDYKSHYLLKILITAKGNILPLLFTHGSFEERIKNTLK